MNDRERTSALRADDRELVDLLTAVLVDPNLHTDLRMRLHREVSAILRAAREELDRAAADKVQAHEVERHEEPLPDLLMAVLCRSRSLHGSAHAPAPRDTRSGEPGTRVALSVSGCVDAEGQRTQRAGVAPIPAGAGPAMTPSSCRRPISASLRPTTCSRISSVCSPSSGARVGRDAPRQRRRAVIPASGRCRSLAARPRRTMGWSSSTVGRVRPAP